MHLVSQLVRAGQSYHPNCKFQFYYSTPCLQMQFPLLDCSRKGLRLSSPCVRSSAFSGSTFSTVMPSTPRPMVSAVGIPLRETIGERWSIHVTTNIQKIYVRIYCMMFLVIYDVLCECILFWSPHHGSKCSTIWCEGRIYNKQWKESRKKLPGPKCTQIVIRKPHIHNQSVVRRGQNTREAG